MRVLQAPTEEFIKLERGTLTEDVAAGTNVIIYVQNTNGLSDGDYLCIGAEGTEGAELVQISSVATTHFTATTLLAHRKGDGFIRYRYNQRKFYGATSTAGPFTELTSYGSPTPIKVDDPQGSYFEYTGLEGYNYFIATYYNSSTQEATSAQDAQPTYADESLRYCSIYAIRKQAGLVINPYITDGMIEVYRKRAESEIKSTIMTRYVLPLVNTAGDSEIPAIIENCAVLLAAGYLDYQEFGKDGEGVKWLGEARGILKSIKNGTMRLIGANDEELVYIANSSQIQSYPDTVDNAEGPTRMFTLSQKF